jgi:thioredoxin 1
MVDMKILKFEADWCGPCHAIRPTVQKISEETGIEVEAVNIDNNPDLAESYGVQSIPTLILVEGGKEIARHSGSAPASKIKSSLGLA